MFFAFYPTVRTLFKRSGFLISLSTTTALVPLGQGQALASCGFSGSFASTRCDADLIGGLAYAGTSSLTITDESTTRVELGVVTSSETPATQTLTITGNTTINNADDSAVYFDTFAPNHTLDVYIGEDVSITSSAGYGTVSLSNRGSGDISVVNDGAVTAAPDGPGIDAAAYGGNITIVNNGHVTSETYTGIEAFGDDFGRPGGATSIVNNGVIDAFSTGIDAGTYEGLVTITNTGTVTSAWGVGLWADSEWGDVSIYNSGTVKSGYNTAIVAYSAAGNITIVNNGWAGNDDLSAAIEAEVAVGSGDISITNTGTLVAPGYFAIWAEADLGSISIVNSGSISGQTGIGAMTGGGRIDIQNSGTIEALEDVGVGLLSGGQLTNSGTISGALAGVFFAGSGNTITTSGTISGGEASVIFVYDGGGNTLNILPNAVFEGVVDYNDSTGNTTTFGAGSYRIPVADYLAAENSIILDNPSQVVVLSDADTTGTINVVTSTPVANIASQYTNSVSDVIGSILSLDLQRPDEIGGSVPGLEPLAYGEVKQASPAQQAIARIGEGVALDRSGNLFWTRAFGGGRHQPDTSDSFESAIYHYGLMAGVDRQSGDARIGAFAGGGAVNADLSNTSDSIDGQTGFAGIYGAVPVNGYVVSTSLTVGAIDSDARRAVNGGEWAEGNFWGWYVSPEVSVSKSYDVASGWSLTPSARLRYVGAFYEGYTESGSSQNISYDARDTHALEGRLQMDLTRRAMLESGRAAAFTLTGAVVDTQHLGDDGYAASLDGTEFTLNDTTARNVAGLRLGASFDVQIKDSMSVYGGIEGTVYTDESVAYTGRLGLKSAF